MAYFNKNNKTAFTTVELLVVVGISSLLGMVAIMLFKSSEKNRTVLSADMYMQSRALNAQNEIIRLIREGKNFVVPRLGEDSPLLCFIDKTSDMQLIYTLKDQQAPSAMTLYKLYHYKLDMDTYNSGQVVLDETKSRLIAEQVKNIKFKVTTANTVSVSTLFASERGEFQILFEAALMNTGEM